MPSLDFSAEIRAGMRRRGIPNALQLAMAAGADPRSVYRALAGKQLRMDTLHVIAEAVGLQIALVPKNLREHGTAAAMRRHQYHREPACALCRRWDAARKRQVRRRGGAAA